MANLFARLLPRALNAREMLQYLHSLGKNTHGLQELPLTLTSEPVHQEYPGGERSQGKREGAEYYYLLKCYPLYNQQGLFSAHALQVHDRTEQVRDEKNRSALLSAVSHDLRTPLAAIKAAVSGLLETGLSWNEDDRREILQDIEGETDHLTVLVNALVEMSRIEMGALNLEKEWCDLLEVFYRALATIERVRGPRSLRLEAQADLPLVYGDYVQLERVFFYLLENVGHYAAEISVRLETLSAPSSPRMLCVTVTDPALVIPVEERERLFSTYTTGSSGTNGLGLAICKGIVEAHQGELRVESAPGGGTRFLFLLPAHSSASLQPDGRAGRAAPRHPVTQDDGHEEAAER